MKSVRDWRTSTAYDLGIYRADAPDGRCLGLGCKAPDVRLAPIPASIVAMHPFHAFMAFLRLDRHGGYGAGFQAAE